MAHSAAAGSRSEHSFDLLAPRYQSPSSSSAAVTTHQQIASATTSRRNSLVSNAAAIRRQSLQVAEIYGNDPMAKHEYDTLAQRRPGDRSSVLVGGLGNGMNIQEQYGLEVQKQRGQYQEEQNQYKDSPMSSLARDRASRDSPVIAELRTNVIVKDEFTLVTDLSYNLVKRYNRPASAIMVKLDHSACLALGGTFDPCYILTITAVSSHMGPTMNKRNAALIQSFMADILSVPPNRGIIKFHQMPEENLAINGTTILGELERQEKHLPSDMRRTFSPMNRRSVQSLHQTTSPKNDLDFNLGPLPQESHVEAAIATTSRPDNSNTWNALPQQTSKSGTTTPFQRSTSETNPQRPSTSHGDSGNKTDFSQSSLRSNSMRNEIGAAYGRLKNGRPKTFSGQDFEMLTTATSSSSIPKLPQLNTATVPLSRKDRALSFLRSDPKASPTPSSAISSKKILHPQTSFQSTSSTSRHDSYLDSPAGGGQTTTIADLKSAAAAAASSSSAANITKRRSTVNATPRMPAPPAPPAIPADAVSVKSGRLGKRKSFLAGFRRN